MPVALTRNIERDIVRIAYVALDGKIANGKNGFSSIVIEPHDGGAAGHFIHRDSGRTVLR
jgi:hypothetical protein